MSVNAPAPGQWSVTISSGGPHTVRITGQSDISFVIGFSSIPVVDAIHIEVTPFIGTFVFTHALSLFMQGSSVYACVNDPARSKVSG